MDLDFLKIQVPRDSRGWPIATRWVGGKHERFKGSFPNRPFRCGCSYGHTGFVLFAGCSVHIGKAIKVAEYDKKRGFSPLWTPNG